MRGSSYTNNNVCCFIFIFPNSPRSTGSTGSSNASLHHQAHNKRKYSPSSVLALNAAANAAAAANTTTTAAAAAAGGTAAEQQQSNLEYLNPAKRPSTAGINSVLHCVYCTKNDFQSLEQLHGHIHQMHAAALRDVRRYLFLMYFSLLCVVYSYIKYIIYTFSIVYDELNSCVSEQYIPFVSAGLSLCTKFVYYISIYIYMFTIYSYICI